jgi:hypothetical protein
MSAFSKYGEDRRFTVRDGAFHHTQGMAPVYEVTPMKAFGFGKGKPFSQIRWRFWRSSGRTNEVENAAPEQGRSDLA